MVLIGITGTHGAGKGTITRYLAHAHGFVCFSVSEFLAEEAVRRGRTPDRHARHNIANEYRAKGPTALMEAVCASVPKDAPRVVLEPQYTVEEVRFIQRKGGMVIGVDASLGARYARVHVRGSPKDDVSFEEFAQTEKEELAAQHEGQQNLAAAMAAADVHITNDGTPSELHEQVERQCKALHLFT